MSEQIDWSKAPEWASVRIRSRATPTLMAWAESYTECVRFLRDDYDGAECRHLAASFWEIVAERPATPSWSGEGLPPVGVVCEVIDGLSNEFTKQFNGKQVEIVAHSKDENYETAVFKVIGFLYDGQARYHSLVASCFKPISTPEQIAADEREAAIRSMLSGFDSAKSWLVSDLAGFIYDKGFRKP